MRDAFGAAYYIRFGIIFIGIFVAILAIALNYTKAFRVKNMIINYIEANDGLNDTLLEGDIEDYVKKVNYFVSDINYDVNYAYNFSSTRGFVGNGCKSRGYCINRQIDGDGRGVYYKVVTFIRIDFPFFNIHLEIPITGETKLVTENFVKK